MANSAQTVNVIGTIKTSRKAGHLLAPYRAQVGGVCLLVTSSGPAECQAARQVKRI